MQFKKEIQYIIATRNESIRENYYLSLTIFKASKIRSFPLSIAMPKAEIVDEFSSVISAPFVN